MAAAEDFPSTDRSGAVTFPIEWAALSQKVAADGQQFSRFSQNLTLQRVRRTLPPRDTEILG